MASPVTISYTIRQSALPRAALSHHGAASAAAAGPRLAAGWASTARSAGNLLARINAGEVTAAPPKTLPPDLPTDEKLADELAARRRPVVPPRLAPALSVAPVRADRRGAPPRAAASGRGAAGLGCSSSAARWWRAGYGSRPGSRGRSRASRAADVLRPDSRTPASVDQLEASPDFGSATPARTPAPTAGGPDSGDAVRFKEALRNLYSVDVASATIPAGRTPPARHGDLATTALARARPREDDSAPGARGHPDSRRASAISWSRSSAR